jgi:hypothetical protein
MAANIITEKRSVIVQDDYIHKDDPVAETQSVLIGPLQPVGGLKRVRRSAEDDDYKKAAMLYLIRPHDAPFAKFGITNTEPRTLKTRYKMYYGKFDMEIFMCEDNAEREAYLKTLIVERGLRYCDGAKELAMNTEETLTLFREVCELDVVPTYRKHVKN